MSYQYFARVYDLLTRNIDYAAIAKCYDGILRKKGITLDLCCGTGTLCQMMSEKGYDMIGADISADMLSQAMRKRSESEANIVYICQAAEKLDLFGTVQNTICSLDSLNHLPDETAFFTAVERVGLFTEQNGMFVFDLNTEYKHRMILGNNRFTYETEAVRLEWQNALQPDGSVAMTLEFFEDGVFIAAEQFTERLFSETQVVEALSRAGFDLAETFDGFTKNPPHTESQRITYAAVKV